MLDIRKNCDLVFDSIIGLLIIDKEAKLKYVDKKTLRLFRLNHDEVIEKDIRTVFTDDENRLYKILETGKPQIGEVFYYEGLTIVSNGYPIFDEEGKLVGAFEYDVFETANVLNSFLKKLDLAKPGDYATSFDIRAFQKAKYTIDNIYGISESVQQLKRTINEVSLTNLKYSQ